MRGEQPQAGARPVNPPAPVGIIPRPIFHLRQRAAFGHDRRGGRFAEKPAEQSRRFRFRQIHVHEHHAGGVEHETAVGIARDDGGGFTGVVLDFMQHRLAERAVGIIAAVFGRKIAMRKTVGELTRGLVGERLRLGDAVGRPAPAEKIPAGSSGPKRWKVHAPTMKRNRGVTRLIPCRRGCQLVKHNAVDGDGHFQGAGGGVHVRQIALPP